MTGREHISYEEKKAYVRKQADQLERELIESHANACPECAAEIESLRQPFALVNFRAARGARIKVFVYSDRLAR